MLAAVSPASFALANFLLTQSLRCSLKGVDCTIWENGKFSSHVHFQNVVFRLKKGRFVVRNRTGGLSFQQFITDLPCAVLMFSSAEIGRASCRERVSTVV